MAYLNNNTPVRVLSRTEQEALDRLTNDRRVALGRVLAAYVLQQADPSDSNAHSLHAAEQRYLDLSVKARDLLDHSRTQRLDT